MIAHASLLVVIDTELCAVVGLDIFSEVDPTLGPRRVCGILAEATSTTYDAARQSLVQEIATSRRWAWALPHLGRCKKEVEAILAERGEIIAKAAPAPGPDARPIAVRACLPESGSYQLVDLTGTRERLVAWVTPGPLGSFVFEEVRADGAHGEAHYAGPSAVRQMWPCSKPVALATAAQLGALALDLPSWAVVPPPPMPPAPIPLEGQSVGFDNSRHGRAVVSSTPSGVVVVRDVVLGLVAIDMNDPTHASALRWIASSMGTVVWERDDGLYESDAVPF